MQLWSCGTMYLASLESKFSTAMILNEVALTVE